MHYDPGFAYEVAHIVKDGLRRMYGYGLDKDKPYGEDVFYYLTVYNEPVPQPAEPENLDVAGLLKGMYRFNEYETAEGDDVPRVQLLGVRCRAAVGPQGPADPRRGVLGRRRHLVGDVVERAAPRRRRGRGAQPAAPGRGRSRCRS